MGGWSTEATCREGHTVEVFYTLPDYGDAPALYQCQTSGDVFAVSPDAEQYIGPVWDERRISETCPTCAEGLQYAPGYPDTFRCPVCGAPGHLALQVERYPTDAARSSFECWDPYV